MNVFSLAIMGFLNSICFGENSLQNVSTMSLTILFLSYGLSKTGRKKGQGISPIFERNQGYRSIIINTNKKQNKQQQPNTLRTKQRNMLC